MALARHRPGEGLARLPAAYDEDVVILGRRQLLGSWESWRRRSLATVMASNVTPPGGSSARDPDSAPSAASRASPSSRRRPSSNAYPPGTKRTGHRAERRRDNSAGPLGRGRPADPAVTRGVARPAGRRAMAASSELRRPGPG